MLPFNRPIISRTFLSVGSRVQAGLDPDPEPLSAPLEVELVVLKDRQETNGIRKI